VAHNARAVNINIVSHYGITVGQPDGDLGGFPAWGGSHIQYPFTRLGVKKRHRQQGNLLLHVVKAGQVKPSDVWV
jgi:hypothetical protein